MNRKRNFKLIFLEMSNPVSASTSASMYVFEGQDFQTQSRDEPSAADHTKLDEIFKREHTINFK